MIADIDKHSLRYLKQSLFITVAIFFISLIVMRVWFLYEILTPAIVSVGYSLFFAALVAFSWRTIVKRSPDSLTTFYTAVSGFRMLLALATMFVYYLIEGRAAMLPFFLVFMTFYFANLIHHSAFFARVSNRS